MDVIGKCRVTRVWEKLIEIRNDDSFTLVLSFCCGIQYLFQVNQFQINSMDVSVSITRAIDVQSRNLFIFLINHCN